MKVIKHKDKWYLQSETGYKEIILTTDQDLIKDGVQAIDDEFLEWFVQNPSCEVVKIESTYKDFNPITYTHKIIIPRECMITKIMQMDAEMAYDSLPKQETLSGFEEGHKANLDWLEQNSNQTKQETLEEAAVINYKKLYEGEPLTQDVPIDAFIDGAKWQKKTNV
jgi:hypothetical protein